MWCSLTKCLERKNSLGWRIPDPADSWGREHLTWRRSLWGSSQIPAARLCQPSHQHRIHRIWHAPCASARLLPPPVDAALTCRNLLFALPLSSTFSLAPPPPPLPCLRRCSPSNLSRRRTHSHFHLHLLFLRPLHGVFLASRCSFHHVFIISGVFCTFSRILKAPFLGPRAILFVVVLLFMGKFLVANFMLQ